MGFFFESFLLNLTTVIVIIIGLIYYYLTSTFTIWEKLNISYVKPEIFYGSVKDIVQFKKSQDEILLDFHTHFKSLGHKYGGFFQLRNPVLLLCSADIVKDFLIKNFVHFHDRPIAYNEKSDPLSAHIIALGGSRWKFVRAKLNPAFSTSKLKGMFIIMKGIIQEYIKLLDKVAEKGEMIEMRKSLQHYTLENITQIAFGLNINALHEESEFFELGKRIFEPTKFERIAQIIINSFPEIYKALKLRLFPKKMTDFFIGMVNDNMNYRRKNNIEKNDFFHFLMKIKDEQLTKNQDTEALEEFSDELIAAQAFAFFLAGYETTSSGMSSCLHELVTHQEVQNKVYEEVDKVINKHGDITYESLQDLVYLEQVIDETLRVHPPVGTLIRKCTKPYQIPETKTVIPEGCNVFISVYAFHRDPEYFSNPEEFRPERFSPENKKNIEPYVFMPFGHGPRVCIGARLAMMQMKMSLALIIKNFRILSCEKTKPFRISPQSFFLLCRDGVWIKLSKREKK